MSYPTIGSIDLGEEDAPQDVANVHLSTKQSKKKSHEIKNKISLLEKQIADEQKEGTKLDEKLKIVDKLNLKNSKEAKSYTKTKV